MALSAFIFIQVSGRPAQDNSIAENYQVSIGAQSGVIPKEPSELFDLDVAENRRKHVGGHSGGIRGRRSVPTDDLEAAENRHKPKRRGHYGGHSGGIRGGR